MKRKSTIIILLIFLFVFTGCSKVSEVKSQPKAEEVEPKEIILNIVTTNKLLYYMVKDIIKDKHNLEYMFTDKNKLWNFSYTDDSINNISKKDIFFYLGTGIEPWAEDFVNNLSKSKVAPLNVSRGIKLVSYEKEVKYKESVIKDNPYFWMNIDDYKIAMLNIKNAIQDKDSKDRDFYENNFSESIKKIDDYQEKLKKVLEKLKEYTFIVDGDELDYFTKNYGLKTLKIYNYGITLTPEYIQKNSEVESKLIDAKNIIFLYDEDEKINANKVLIEKYNIKTANISVYKDDMTYIDMLDNNLKNLEKLIIQ
ncbi:zinc ABC transporter substrate-binding protein [Clostridium sp. SYSU_GA19001]|uniref:metal ABC transporter substrate-binding protein n=1 Tax=Clostridium caldaquaticum TaxID=2940653 RepID=UPI002076E083|nr:zinc ABC transporter substrate-binding protein [Clostridium caldaquaticum]MCM8709762.1 zinc ABC transporter substrate-binding protein [Clostridium caldaquaticum]